MTRPFPIPNAVATCAYKQFQDSMGVLIGTSTGNNRQRAGIIYARTLAPWSTFRKIEDPVEAEPVYRAQLDRDIAKIEDQLSQVSDRVRYLTSSLKLEVNPVLVFACFEDLGLKDYFCHRTWLAGWLNDTYGIEVPELGRTRTEVVASGDTLV